MEVVGGEELIFLEPDPQKDFVDEIDSVFQYAERQLNEGRFDLSLSKILVDTLRNTADNYAKQGCTEEAMEDAMVRRACRPAEQIQNSPDTGNPRQIVVYLCCVMAVFKHSISLQRQEEGRLVFVLTPAGTACYQFIQLLVEYSHLRALLDPSGLQTNQQQIHTLSDLSSWLERERPSLAYFVALKSLRLYMLTVTVCPTSGPMLEPYAVTINMLVASCLIREGFLEFAESFYKKQKRKVNVSSLPPRLFVKHKYIHACLLQNCQEYSKSLDTAQEALRNCKDETEKREIKDLINQLNEALAGNQEESYRICGIPDPDWLEGTNAFLVEESSVRQNAVRDSHRVKAKRRRPKARVRDQTPESIARSPGRQHNANMMDADPFLVMQITSDLQSNHSSSGSTINSSDTQSETGTSATGSLPVLPDSEEETEDEEEVYDQSVYFLNDDDDQRQNEDLTQVENLISLESDKTWFEESEERIANNLADPDEREEVEISEKQMESFDKIGRGEPFYTDLIKNKEELERLVESDPDRYKRCQLKIESAHRSVAKVLDKGSKFSEILINGRSKCGRTFNEDEVVVEILAEPGQSRGLETAIANSDADVQTIEKLAHGQVIGLIRRVRCKDVEHPVFVCTLDEIEGHLMKPLCKTVPKIHVLNDTVKQRYPALVKHRIEIKEISSDGSVQFKRFVNIDPDKREQYVFKVAIISWRSQAIYPLGVVLEAHIGGNNYTGGLEVLLMQQRVPKYYPRSAVTHTNTILQSGSPNTANRRDLTDKLIFTIDPPNSQDLDDALSIWKTERENHYVVGVHIADVAAWVEKGTPVDQEAQRRAVTFYPLGRKTHPMLPEPLSRGKCSLLPNEERLALSVFFKFDENCNLLDDNELKVQKTIIKSKKKFSYDEVQKIINSDLSEDTDSSLSQDVLQLHNIASKLSETRRKNSTFYVPFEDPRLQDLEGSNDSREAHSLVEEFMILANSSVAKHLRTRYPGLMILRCHKAPSWEELNEWNENENGIGYLVMQLQGKKITPGSQLSVDNIESENSVTKHHDVIVQKEVWRLIEESFETGDFEAVRKVSFMDALHPLQCLANQHWMELMESAEYKCSHGLNQPDHLHFGLNLECYTHFTSPIRRYADLHVQRLMHAYLDAKKPDCTPDEVMQLCRHINSVTARQKAFGKGCKALKIADQLRKPLTFRAFVNCVDTEQLNLILPSLLAISDRKQEIPFSIMGVCSQPVLITDTMMKKDTVTVKWNKRIYNDKGICPGDLTVLRRWLEFQRTNPAIPIEIDINPHQFTEYVKHIDWAKMLKMLMCENNQSFDVPLTVQRNARNVNHMSSEKGDGTISLRQYHFKMECSAGQVLKVQMTADAKKGILRPRVELVQITRNVSMCLTHAQNAVSALCRSANRATREQKFNSYTEYVRAWMPLLEMEGACGAGDIDNTVLLENVQVCMRQKTNSETSDRAVYTGTFRLSAKFCFDRSIEFGDESHDDSNEDYKCKFSCPVGYLCIRYRLKCDATIVSRLEQSDIHLPIDDHYTWVGHASIVEVKHKNRKSEDGGQKHVKFELSPNSPKPPEELMTDFGDEVMLEILPKSDVDRRTQQMLLQLENDELDLAQAIAFSKRFPKLDPDHLHLGKRDKNHEVEKHLQLRVIEEGENVLVTGLPKNNPPQHNAIKTALTHSLSLIQGPPGTGKTYTGVKLVYLFNKINRQLESEGKGRKVVLYCGPSNKSVDLVAKLIKNRLGDHCPKVLRVYGSAIETKDYPVPRSNVRSSRGMRDLKSDPFLQDITLHHLIRESGKTYAEDISTFEKHFARCRDNPELVTSKQLKDYRKLLFEASVEEIGHYEVILTTCAVGGSSKLVKGTEGRIFQVIIDECGMSPEPHTLMPIIATKAKQVVLIGDHKQLRPIIKCQPAAELGLDQSLFERLYNSLPPDMLGFLSTQYRMHQEICEFPSQMFYNGKLVTGKLRQDLLPFWPRDPISMYEIPHILVDVRGEEETLTVSSEEGNERSKSNIKEAEKVAEIFKFLKKEFNVEPSRIRVLTQYNAQRHLLEEKLHKLCEDRSDDVFSRYDKSKINVTTVVSSQGGEWDYVILSTVRSLPSYKIEPRPTIGWCRQNLGFITDRNQVNVALTRARYGLIIVGNVELLECDSVWKKLVQRYKENDCIYADEDFPPPPPKRIYQRHHQPSATYDWQTV